jgi:hypothetical protein
MSNEIIKLLAQQARKQPMGNSWTYLHSEQFEEKFADLIIFECIKIALFKGDSATGKAIKQHFGVEE